MAEHLSTEMQQLAPRITADVLVDGELKPATLQKHLRRTTRTCILWLAAAVFVAVHLAMMLMDSQPLLLLIGQAGLLGALGTVLRDQWGQRAVLARLLASDPLSAASSTCASGNDAL